MNRLSYYLVLAKHTTKKVKKVSAPKPSKIKKKKSTLTEKERIIREEKEDKLFPFLL